MSASSPSIAQQELGFDDASGQGNVHSREAMELSVSASQPDTSTQHDSCKKVPRILPMSLQSKAPLTAHEHKANAGDAKQRRLLPSLQQDLSCSITHQHSAGSGTRILSGPTPKPSAMGQEVKRESDVASHFRARIDFSHAALLHHASNLPAITATL